MDRIAMIIECINCSVKYHLNENILKPNGSNVRCTKCGQVFIAFPICLDSNEQSLSTENEMNSKNLNYYITDTPSAEQSIDHKIEVSVPASCIWTDDDGNSLDFNIGRITEIGPEGLAIEIFCSSTFEYSSISFITLDDKEVHIKGKVVHSKRNELGKMKIGLALIGTSKEITDFVLQLVRHHHYATKPVEKVQGKEKEKDQHAISCSDWAT
jgi:predicted Zn finger-like uncharacterized protein